MPATTSARLIAISLLTILFTVMAALPANAMGGSMSKAQKEIMALKWNCDAKNLAKLDQLIRKGVQRKLGKKVLDRARYRHDFAKRVLGENDKALCLATLQSGARVLAFAKPERAPVRNCLDVMKPLPNWIAYGIAGNADVGQLSAAETEYAKAERALKLRGRTNSSSRNTLCLKHADATKTIIAKFQKVVRAKVEANYVARLDECKKRGARRCSRKDLEKIKRVGPHRMFLCNDYGFSVLSAEIADVTDTTVAAAAKKHIVPARRARSARQWDKCVASLRAGRKVIADKKKSDLHAEIAGRHAKEKARFLEKAKECHAQPHKNLVRLLRDNGKVLGVASNILASAAVIESRLIVGRIYCKRALGYTYSAAEMPHLTTLQNFKKTVAARSTIRVQSNTDIPGQQFKVISLRGGATSERAADCSFMCQVDQRCKSFTFATTSSTGRPRHTCNLKAFKGNGVRAVGVTSGTKTPR